MYFKDPFQLVGRVFDAGESRAARQQFDEYAADAPQVQRRRVVGGAEEDFGRSIPKCHHFARERVRRDRLGPGET